MCTLIVLPAQSRVEQTSDCTKKRVFMVDMVECIFDLWVIFQM